MKRLTVYIATALLLVIPSHVSGQQPCVEIAGVDMMNLQEEPLDSHSGLEMHSSLEPVAKYNMVIPAAKLGCVNPVYARIKKMQDGRYFLMYHNGRIGSNVYYNTSSDLFTWDAPVKLFSACPTVTPDGEDERRYSSADAIVLQNGDILAYVAARANYGYRYFPQCNYISMKRSCDNAKTWGEEEFIYNGTTWEPFMLQIPSGKIQCYFTDTYPKLLNSGTSYVESSDNGHTWSPQGVGECFKTIRQYKYTVDGVKLYTDQMPCVRLLNNGETYLGFMEARLEEPCSPDGNTYYKMSVVRGHGEWKQLEDGEEGPEDRDSNVIDGAAGYVAQFPSGETVLSCNMENIFKLKLGNSDGTLFQGNNWCDRWMKAFPLKGYWGSTEVISSHELLAVMHCSSGIQLCKYYLNHKIKASHAEITVDGNSSDWSTTSSWFIGSEFEKVQTCIRAAQDDENLYFLFDRKDSYLQTGDDITIYISGSDDLKNNSLSIRLSSDAKVNWKRFRNNSWKPLNDKNSPKGAIAVSGVIGDNFPDEGYVGEISLSKQVVPVPVDGYLRVMVVVHNSGVDDSFTWADEDDPSTWMLLEY